MAVQEQTTRRKRRNRPEYAAVRVSDLPEDVTQPRTGPRTDPKFTEAMQVAQNDPGIWYLVGVYKSDNGAKTMAAKIDKKDVKIPKGDWELETRRVNAEDGEGRWSHLYAKFLG